MSNEIGNRISVLINQLGVTRNKFAQQVKTPATVIYNILNGRNKPGYELLYKILTTYNVNADWLMKGDGDTFISTNKPVLQPVMAALSEIVLNDTTEKLLILESQFANDTAKVANLHIIAVRLKNWGALTEQTCIDMNGHTHADGLAIAKHISNTTTTADLNIKAEFTTSDGSHFSFESVFFNDISKP